MRCICRHLLTDQAQAYAHAVNVHISTHDRI